MRFPSRTTTAHPIFDDWCKNDLSGEFLNVKNIPSLGCSSSHQQPITLQGNLRPIWLRNVRDVAALA